MHVKVKKVTLAEEHMRQIQSIGGMMCLLEGIMGVLEKMEVAETTAFHRRINNAGVLEGSI